MEVTIKLNEQQTAHDWVNVDLQWSCVVTKWKKGLAKIFRKYNKVCRPDTKLDVRNIKFSDKDSGKFSNEVVCDKSALFAVLIDGEITAQKAFPASFPLSHMKEPFQLLFDKSAITDCTRPQEANERSYRLSFDVVLLNKRDKVVDTGKGEISLVFAPLGLTPTYEIAIAKQNIQYSSALSREKVATFRPSLAAHHQFAPSFAVQGSVSLYRGQEDLSQYVSFANGTRLSTAMTLGYDACTSAEDIFVDFTAIPNPRNATEQYTIKVEMTYAAEYSPNMKDTLVRQEMFTLLQDQQGTELRGTVSLGDGTYSLTDPLPPVTMEVVPHSNMTGQVQVLLQNLATDNSNRRAGLYLTNLTVSEQIENASSVRVVDAKDCPLTAFVTLDGRDKDKLCSANGLFLANGPSSSTALTLTFDPSSIETITGGSDHSFSVVSILTFDYYEDRDGVGKANVTKKTQSLQITWHLHLLPYPQWLCVDYGSSAIVCLYDKNILDLKRQKDALFGRAYKGQYTRDSFETGTPFLSSDIVLHQQLGATRSTLCCQYPPQATVLFDALSVCLSPTSSLVERDVTRLLPCLKILVGNEFLPQNNSNYTTFQYTRSDSTGAVATVTASTVTAEDTCLLRVAAIFREAYASLFRYFIAPVAAGKNINKLVLTYPNTYTPVHLNLLEDIARATFPQVRDGYLRFVSESDAVAAYYLDHWAEFNPGGDIHKSETVLVYDMGAGTLDLTLFKKHSVGGKVVVDILGKIGSGKAGNYLDYLLCEILRDDIAPGTIGSNIVSTAPATGRSEYYERLRIKGTVKSSIKPRLQRGSTLTFNNIPFDAAVILDNPRFSAYLTAVTETIISRLLASVGDSVTIDTVLMSGRGCRLSALEDRLRRALRTVNARRTPIHQTPLQQRIARQRIPLHDGGYLDIPPRPTTTTDCVLKKIPDEGNKEKTAVVEGALARADIFDGPSSPVEIRSRRLYASYGVVYKALGGRYKYVELLNSSALPLSSAAIYDNHTGPNTTLSGTAAAGSLTLVQTYLSSADTQQAYNDNDREFITVMADYHMSQFGKANTLNVKLMLDYKNNISLYVNGAVSKGTPPQGVDLANEITKCSIWPVTI